MLFQWVCQHFRSQRKIRFKLFNIIQQSFRTQKPTPLFRSLAAWNTPGYICTYFDGLLQQALQESMRPVQVINSLSSQVAPEPGTTLLVHLRGHWSDPNSLVLTEEQHNALLDCLVTSRPYLARLVARLDRPVAPLPRSRSARPPGSPARLQAHPRAVPRYGRSGLLRQRRTER